MVPRASLPKMVIPAAVGQATKERTATKVGTLRCKSFIAIKTPYTMKRTDPRSLGTERVMLGKVRFKCIFFYFKEIEELFLYIWLIGYQEKRSLKSFNLIRYFKFSRYMYSIKSLILNSLTETADEEFLRECRQQ